MEIHELSTHSVRLPRCTLTPLTLRSGQITNVFPVPLVALRFPKLLPRRMVILRVVPHPRNFVNPPVVMRNCLRLDGLKGKFPIWSLLSAIG